MCRHSTMLDDLVPVALTLAAHPRNAGAQAIVRQIGREWRKLKAEEAAQQRLVAAADQADEMTRSTPGYRADLDG